MAAVKRRAACGSSRVSSTTLDEATRRAYRKRVDELFEQAYASPAVGKQYTLLNWARAMYGCGDYAAAWAKVKDYRKVVGQEFDSEFLRVLSAKMPEP